MKHYLLVGTFTSPTLYTLAFDPDARSLELAAETAAGGAHSWLSLSADKTRLYATMWSSPPALAAYSIEADAGAGVPLPRLLSTVPTRARSGYCCASSTAVYSAGGPTGEVFAIDPATGAFTPEAEPLQLLEFVDSCGQVDSGGVLDFGGLRHGAHSVDLSPDGKLLYVADIGRNCVFVYAVAADGSLTLTDKNIAPRPNDGPRHVTPHPNGRMVYSLQEHTSMVDVFELGADSKLRWLDGVKIIPKELSPSLFWADEVRLSHSTEFLYASTRGLEPSQRGYLAAFALAPDGRFASAEPVAMWESPTSGGWANAVEPAPKGPLSTLGGGRGTGVDYMALTDSEQGLVMILSFDGARFEEVARVQLDAEGAAATAVWL